MRIRKCCRSLWSISNKPNSRN